ncbi:hypothetical protein OPW07_10425 [Vibrio europaeus]|uniref:Uncharacterized protein n=1 Tax=Vibrio europaeus TaxID=300876 RepID=A0AAE7ATS1_9VIBR|nr:hypothetical protein [Vibrio europaeus]MDC5810130.1 hypothetical protein [Vibrio europaeus]QJY36255.1 hypothetical protein HOO69_06345 [Vibrio europaeus]QPG35068.1 hypothetical protein IXK98_16440 [Vibrio europaeus]
MNKIQTIKVLSPTLCDFCISGEGHYSDLLLIEINPKPSSWELRGSGELKGVTTHCPMCDEMYHAVERHIPINVSSLSCPTCGESETLELKVGKLNHTSGLSGTGEVSFEFQAELQCNNCHDKKSISEKLWDALGISEIEITLTGIRVKRA